jgi:hypothetical protein
MNSEISTKRSPEPEAGPGFQAWHLYLLLGMAGATVAVWRANDTQPAALLLLSAAVLAAGLVAIAVHYTVLGFQGYATLEREPIDTKTRQALEQEKAMVLRSIKELEFDRAMRKVSDADFAELDGRLRARAVALMEQLEAAPVAVADTPAPRGSDDSGTCPNCGGANDGDARFCKNCGQRLTNE